MKQFFILMMAVCMCGCMMSPKKNEFRYLLEPNDVERKIPINVLKIELPSYLDQSCLVRRVPGNLVEYIDGHAWTGSLGRVLDEALASVLKEDAKRSVVIKIRRFDVGEDNVFRSYIDIIEGEKIKQFSYTCPCNAQVPADIADATKGAFNELIEWLIGL